MRSAGRRSTFTKVMNQMNLAKMKLLPLMCFFVLMWTGQTFADGPKVVSVKEDGEAILSCSFDDIDMTNERFDWKKDGKDVYLYDSGKVREGPNFTDRVTHFSEPLKSGKVSIRIKPVQLSDSGTYICKYPQKKPEIRGTIKLTVGTCPKPIVRALSRSKNIVLVECKAVGAFPQPKIELQNKNNNSIPVKELTYSDNGTIILTAEVTKEDHYSCVVRQPDICHEIRSEPTLLGVPGASGVLQLSSGLLLLPLLGLLNELFSAWP